MDGLKNSDFWKLIGGDNQVFAGGLGLAIIATGAHLMRSGSNIGLTLLKRHFLITLEVTSKDRAFPWILKWLATQGKKTQHLSVETALSTIRPSVSTSSSSSSIFSLVPGPGQHFLTFQGKFISVQRFREMTVDLNTGKPWEKVQLMAFGRDPSPLQAILEESYKLATTQEEGKTIIYTNWGSEWRVFGNPRFRRPLSSVILDDGVSERLFKDVLEWQQSTQWYNDRGIPYRRGYLLHGPPGSGKSSFIFALAGQLGFNICMLNLAERGLTDDRLALALSNVPPMCIVLLEDIDAAFPCAPRVSNSTSSGLSKNRNLNTGSDVTFSGLLNVLDGVASSEERIIFMTTNYIEHLDSALIRPGRVDIVEFIGDASHYQLNQMYMKFYPETIDISSGSSKKALQFAETVLSSLQAISMASLQGFFLQYKDDPDGAIRGIDKFLESEANKHSTVIEHQSEVKSIDDEAQRLKAIVKAKRGPLTVADVDNMVFNPQSDWEKDVFFTGKN